MSTEMLATIHANRLESNSNCTSTIILSLFVTNEKKNKIKLDELEEEKILDEFKSHILDTV